MEILIQLFLLKVHMNNSENGSPTLLKKVGNSSTFLISCAAKIPFIVGGGNDQSYPNAAALLDAVAEGYLKGPVGVVNIDAHLDVRPLNNAKVHSGSPFRLLLEDSNTSVSQSLFSKNDLMVRILRSLQLKEVNAVLHMHPT